MTAEEKLSKAVEFIKSIEKLNKKDYDIFSIDDLASEAYAYCNECDEQVDVQLNWPRNVSLNTEYIDNKCTRC